MSSGNRDFKLPSGATLRVTIAPYRDAKDLHDAVLRALRGKSAGSVDVADLVKNLTAMGEDKSGLKMGAAGGAIVDLAIGVLTSTEVEAAVLKCGQRAVYEPIGAPEDVRKVDPGLFDDPKHGEDARGDMYAIYMRVAEVNLGPFFKALFSALKARAGTSADTPKPS